MKKICVLQNSLTYGGTDTFVINLCEGLVKDGYEVTVVLSMDENEPRPRFDDLEKAGVNIVFTCAPRSLSQKLKHLILLYKELKRGKYDAFQTNIDLFNGPNMFGALLRLLSTQYWVFARIGGYFNRATLLLIPKLFDAFDKKNKNIAGWIILALYFVYMILLLLKGEGTYYPYVSIFNSGGF